MLPRRCQEVLQSSKLRDTRLVAVEYVPYSQCPG